MAIMFKMNERCIAKSMENLDIVPMKWKLPRLKFMGRVLYYKTVTRWVSLFRASRENI